MDIYIVIHIQPLTVIKSKIKLGTYLAVQWLRLRTSTAGGTGSIPGPGTKIPRAAQYGQKKKKRLEKQSKTTNKIKIIRLPNIKDSEIQIQDY